MPSQPPSPYDRDFDFEQFSQLTPNAQQPGQEINQELDALASSVNQTISRLGEIQRDDGKLKDGIFDFAPMNNAVIEAQSARDDAVAAKVEAVAAKDYITVTASGLEASVALTAAAANASKNLSLYHANQAGTYATQSAVSAIAAANSASSAAATATNAMNFSADAYNSAAAAAGSATSAANSLTSITTGLLSKLTNSINWTGAYDNGVTYQAGDGVIFNGEYFVLKAYIGAAGYDPAAYASSWTKLIPAGVGGNPFDQSLNAADEVAFRKTTLSDGGPGLVVVDPYWLGTGITHTVVGNVAGMTALDGFSHTNDTSTISVKASIGITFPDATVQTTAYTGPSNPFDQSLNTNDTANFYQLSTSGSLGSFIAVYDYTSLVGQSIQSYGSVGTLTISADQGITFADSTVQTTAYTGATNPFNQNLNTTDSVVFATIDASRDVSIVKYADSGSEIPLVQVRQDQQLATLSAGNLYLSDSSSGTAYAYNGIFFNDGSSQNTAFVPANYLTASQVSSTYQTISGMSAYQTVAGMSAYAALSSANAFTGANTFTVSAGSSVPLTVSNAGIGNSFVVNDSIPDTTPFVINSAGLVGINVTTPGAMLDIAHSLTSGTGIRLSVASGQSFNASAGLLFVNIQNTGATGKGLVIENRGTGDCLYIHDSAATDTTPFVVNNNGDCIIGGQTVTAGYKLDVIGNAKVNAIKIGSSSDLSAVNYTTTGQPATVDRTTYPNEIQVVINGVTYAMPARQV